MPTETGYEVGQCGRSCHPTRYRVIPVWRGIIRRWGVRDEHLGVTLRRTESARWRADGWCMVLQDMESSERQMTTRLRTRR